MAAAFPSSFTFLVYFLGELSLLPIFGSGVGTKGAGGPGILQMLGTVAIAIPVLPAVTGVFGPLTMTVMRPPSW